MVLLKLLFRLDHLVFRLLRRLIRLLDAIFPFGKRRLVLTFLALYLFSETAAIVSEHEALSWILGPLFVMGFVLYSLERGRRNGLERHVPSLLLRMVVSIWMLPGAVNDFVHHRPWEGLAAVAYVGLFYAIDMGSGPPRKRRRVFDTVGRPAPRPGFSTAG